MQRFPLSLYVLLTSQPALPGGNVVHTYVSATARLLPPSLPDSASSIKEKYETIKNAIRPSITSHIEYDATRVHRQGQQERRTRTAYCIYGTKERSHVPASALTIPYRTVTYRAAPYI